MNKGVSSAPVPLKDFGTLALARRNLPALESPSLGTTFIAPVVSSLPSRCKRTGLSLLKNAGCSPLVLKHTFGTLSGPTARLLTVTNEGSHTLWSQMKPTFCTLAGDQTVTNADDDSGSKFHRGNVEALLKRIAADTSYTTTNYALFDHSLSYQ